MKTIIKLLIALVILNAVARGAMAAWSYYEFRDAAAELVLFGSRATTTELHDQILSRAGELDVPVAPANVNVQRQGARTWADVSYTQPVEYFPRNFYPVELSFTVDAFSTTGATPP
jgi:hypothetical protein